MASQLSCPPPFPHVLTIKNKDSITMEVMICTVPMPPSVLTAIVLSQLAHVACGICDSNTAKNDRHVVALKLLQHMCDITASPVVVPLKTLISRMHDTLLQLALIKCMFTVEYV